MKIVFIFLFVMFAMPDSTEATDTGTVQIQVDNLQNKKGQLGVLIFKAKSGYPDQHEEAYRSIFTPINDQKPIITIKDLPYGDYTITIMHDENNNGVFDKTIFSVPKEGYGVSNNPEPRTFGPPQFEEGMIKILNELTTIKIKLRYHD